MQGRDILVVDIWRAVQARLFIVLGTMILFGVFAGLGAYFMTPVYRSTVLIAPVVDQDTKGSLGGLLNQFSGLASLAGVTLGTGTTTKDEAIAILTSRAFTVKFIAENNLLPVLFQNRWNPRENKWSVADETPDLSDGFRVFSGARIISEDRQTGFVHLSVEWSEPELAAAWANGLVARVNEVMRTNAIADAMRGIEYLERELEKTSVVELRQGIFSLIEGQINRIMLANVRDEYAFRVLDQAVVPDLDEYVRPRRALMIIMGLLIGAVIGVGLALGMYVRRREGT